MSEQILPSSAPPNSGGGRAFDWRINLGFFVATLAAVFLMGALAENPAGPEGRSWVAFLLTGWTYAVPLMVILLCHEFGHYIAARLHGVSVSLPYFIPLPIISLFGTLGAVITMPERIRSRNALLDIGAAGPLAGMAVAVPIIWIGLANSTVSPAPEGGYFMEGQSLLYLLLKRLAVGPIPDGQDVFLHPTAFAGWVGLFVTMLNLVPFGQLDGGHILYALLGERAAPWGKLARYSLLAWFVFEACWFVVPVLLGTSKAPLGQAIGNAMPWLVWFGLLTLMTRLPGGGRHPPTDDATLSPGRRWVGWGCLLLLAALFMPTPMAAY